MHESRHVPILGPLPLSTWRTLLKLADRDDGAIVHDCDYDILRPRPSSGSI